MQKLLASQFKNAHAIYLRQDAYFPLIAAVLEKKQNGVVFTDSVTKPVQYYVEHEFGFAQIFGEPIPEFEVNLKSYMLLEKSFFAPKIRLYTPYCPIFLKVADQKDLLSWRQHFEFDADFIDNNVNSLDETLSGGILAYADNANVSMIQDEFGLVTRFWRTTEDFLQNSNAVLALQDDQVVAICYAAAVADGMAEIDVVTSSTFRNRGIAKFVVSEFIKRCVSNNVKPLWDCFTNNTASMALCRSFGFKPLGSPYPFYTIGK